jgi:UDP-N-acetylmuramate dehydrogenase
MMAVSKAPWHGELREQEPLKRYTSWRVGGPADALYRPASIDDLAAFLRDYDSSVPLTWIGLGSNVLVRDGGIRGLVVYTVGCLDDMRVTGPGQVRVEAGVASAKVARFCSRENLSGAEFLAGIPGSFGGALAMNAGAFGSETWDIVSSVETIDRRGNLRHRRPDEYTVAYRRVSGHENEWFVAAQLALQPGEASASRQRVRQLLERRAATQPVGTANAGSVFKNPPGDHAARLIESCGLKGYRIGGACVSDKHANFIVNDSTATATDIENLIRHVQQTVLQQTGISLQPEVRVIGEPAR